MIERQIQKPEIDVILQFLLSVDLFKKFKPSILREIIISMTLCFLKGGETLINQGDTDSTMYILKNGRLRVFVKTSSSKELVSVAEISKGQIVGEIALLADEPRTGTVRAIHDSFVLKLDKKNFNKLKTKYPHEALDVSVLAIKRLIHKIRPTESGENIKTIAIAPAGDSDHRAFVYELKRRFEKISPTLIVNQQTCNQQFDKQISQAGFEDVDSASLTNWLISLENQYKYIIYETDRQMTPWTQRCLRQADKILLVADTTTYPARNSIEINLFTNEQYSTLPSIELVLVHPDKNREIIGTDTWLKSRPVKGYHHLKIGIEKDFEKLLRFLHGKAFGIVLNGGGVRGFAHMGVIKALEEQNIPIDFVGGTSMGGYIAALYLKFGAEGMIQLKKNKQLVKRLKKISTDYTFPFISLLEGKNFTEFCHDLLGNTLIENFDTRFFCVSADVTQGSINIHERGPIYEAIRATTSLPAIYPPVYDKEGNMLVDGGVINNMPVNIMRQFLGGGKIIAVNCNTENNLKKIKSNYKMWMSGWNILFKMLNPFKTEKIVYNNIFQVLCASITLSSDKLQVEMQKEANCSIKIDTSRYGLFSYNDLDAIIELGYQKTIEMQNEITQLTNPHESNKPLA